MASKKREHLVQVAADLFIRDGFHATGVDRILEESGVARMTLYNHFKSKEELIVAALEYQDLQVREWLVAAVERLAKRPADRLLAIFDAFDEWFRGDGFSGCLFIKASGEFPNPENPIRQTAVEHQQMIVSYIRGLGAEAGARDPEQLAQQLYLLLEGAIVTAHMTGNPEAAKEARAAAEILVRNATTEEDR